MREKRRHGFEDHEFIPCGQGYTIAYDYNNRDESIVIRYWQDECLICHYIKTQAYDMNLTERLALSKENGKLYWRIWTPYLLNFDERIKSYPCDD